MPRKLTIILYKSLSGHTIVEEFIDSLDINSRVCIRNAIRLLSEFGLELMKDKMVKKIYQKPALYELRVLHVISIRLLFFRYDPKTVVVVHGFIKKTQKLPIKELKVALRRAREFI
jgi:phage-related protein